MVNVDVEVVEEERLGQCNCEGTNATVNTHSKERVGQWNRLKEREKMIQKHIGFSDRFRHRDRRRTIMSVNEG